MQSAAAPADSNLRPVGPQGRLTCQPLDHDNHRKSEEHTRVLNRGRGGGDFNGGGVVCATCRPSPGGLSLEGKV